VTVTPTFGVCPVAALSLQFWSDQSLLLRFCSVTQVYCTLSDSALCIVLYGANKQEADRGAKELPPSLGKGR